MDHRLRHIHAKQTSSDLSGWQIALSSQTWVQTATHSSHQNFNWRLWTLLFNTVPQTTCSKLPKAPWIISDPYDRGWEPPVQHPWWFWLFISNAVLSPFMYIILLKLKQPALQKICHGIKQFGVSTSWSWKGWGRPEAPLQLHNALHIPVVLEMINTKRQRVTKDTDPWPVSSDIRRFSADYEFNSIYRNQLKKLFSK